ncbi:hypothetical protein ACJOV8_004585 [Formosa sp. 3Alg 14/1]|uniref:hypothetical protein n=1 Tax=Formosa sp. 3Alg 14/1 TaxID=3382190 RepID=UPI0039BE81FF
MRKLLALSIYMFAMITGISSYANDNLSNVDSRKKSEITLTLNHVKAGQLLSIKDEYGIALYKSTISTSGAYNNTFDLTALPNGDYSFEHEKGLEIKIIPFTVSNEEVTFNREEERSIFKPSVKFKNNAVYLTQLDLDKEEVSVNIYYSSNDSYSNDELIYTEKISDEASIQRIYSLSEKRAGHYKVFISANGRNYVEHFKI